MEPLNLKFDLTSLQEKSALITGGASGLGLATAQKWADAGVSVTIADIQPPTGPMQPGLAQCVHYVHCDVTSWESQVVAFKAALRNSPTGSLDIVACFAGTALAPGNQVDHVLAAGIPDLDIDPPKPNTRNIDVNLVGSYYTSWLGLYYMRIPGTVPHSEQPNSNTKALLFCASIAAYMDSPKASTYPASKFGVRGLFRSTRAQTQQLGVRCNLLAPWFFDSPLIAPIKNALASRGVDMAKVLAFTTVDACVEAASYCVADSGVHGKFIEELGMSPTLDGPYDKLMKGWKNILAELMARYRFAPPDLSIQTQDKIVNGVRTRIYTPPAPESWSATDDATLPIALYFHAGGWVTGSIDEEDAFVRSLSKFTRTTIVSVGYRLAPEFQFPIPLDDCVAMAQWTLTTYPGRSVSLIGASAGGNLAFSTALSLIDCGLGDRVQGVVALAPVTIHPAAVPAEILARGEYTSYAENDRLTINTGSAMRTFLECYGAPPADPRLSCLLHPRLAELGRVYVAVGGADTLRDDVRLMKGALDERGVPVQCDEYPGYPHFSWLFPSPALREHQALFFENLVRGVRWVRG
ncbi:hypothetical protein BDW74DRAFT_189635 [Aspergillus multicolor]|uniref:uncharacterized protein n=1 Tax=Aspergillus multicolor TaxID=41759 RepID=UPI003CCCDD4B